MFSRYAALLSASIAASALLAGPAFAVDAKAFADRLVALYANQGGELTYSAAEADGENVTIKGLTLPLGKGQTLSLGDVLFETVEEDGGDWTAETATFADIDTTTEGAAISVKGITMEGLWLPSGPELPFLLYDRFEILGASVTAGDTPVFTMENYAVDVEIPDALDRMDFTSAAEKITVTAPATADAKSVETMTALFGGTTVTGKMVMNGAWTSANGRLELTEFSAAIPGSGKLNLAFGFDGYTTQFMKTLGEVTKSMEASAGDQNAEAAQGMAMMGLMQQLSFVNMMLRYEDEGLANKVIDQIAKEQGRPRDVLISETKAIAPLALSSLQKPEFAAAVTKAVSDFLDNPKSFTIKAQPDAPVSGAILMATGMSAPQNLIDTLKVTVTAND